MSLVGVLKQLTSRLAQREVGLADWLKICLEAELMSIASKPRADGLKVLALIV